MIPSAESGGESFVRLMRCSIDVSSVMGLYVDDDEAKVGRDTVDVGGDNTGTGSAAGGAETIAGADK